MTALATLTIKADADIISDIVDVESEYNMACDEGHELYSILVNANELFWDNVDANDLTNLFERIELYGFDMDADWE